MIRIQDVSFSVGTKHILERVSMEARPGQLVGILGPNGAGKSTLMNIISGSLNPTSGSVMWRGKDLHTIPGKELALERAVLTQKVHIQGAFTVEEVVMMGRFRHFKQFPRAIDKEIVQQCLKQTNTQQFHKRLFRSLSGGEQQRVQFARVLAQLAHDGGPYALLLDEPLNNLDVKFQQQLLMQARHFAAKGHVVLVVLHDLNLAGRFADKILLLAEGKVQGFGTPADVLKAELLTSCYDVPTYVYSHPITGAPTVSFGNLIPSVQPKISDTKWKSNLSPWPSAGKN
ncbi:MAG: heme ABC transporter ATP-binding protein [Bacteroidota bacterium]